MVKEEVTHWGHVEQSVECKQKRERERERERERGYTCTSIYKNNEINSDKLGYILTLWFCLGVFINLNGTSLFFSFLNEILIRDSMWPWLLI